MEGWDPVWHPSRASKDRTSQFFPLPKEWDRGAGISPAAPHVFAHTGETSFYERCTGKGADVITHQPSLALQSPQTPKQGSLSKKGRVIGKKKKEFGSYKQRIV